MFFFFFKQKTAYEIYQCDWSSDVCSSDLPREVPQKRRLALAFRWLINAARNKKGKPMAEKLADELLLAAKNEGEAVKKKDDMHRMADANKAFAHFAW